MTREDGAGRGDDVYQPDPAADRDIHEDTGVLDPEDTLEYRDVERVGLDGDLLDEGFSPPQRPLAVEDTGTTDREQHSGESLDQRLARERPDLQSPPDEGTESFADGANELFDLEPGGSRFGRPAGPDGGAGSRRDGPAPNNPGPAADADDVSPRDVRDLEEAIEDEGL